MKLKFVLFIVFAYFLIALNPYIVLAEETYIKSEDNPIVFTNEIDGWNEIGQRQPSVLFENSKYRLWYTSQSSSVLRIGYAESDDLNNFTSVSLVNINYDLSYDFHDPSIIKIGNQYQLYFAVSKGGGKYKILRATSNDGINFDDEVIEILSPGVIWDKRAVSGPTVIYEDSKYYMFFTGWNSLEWRVGLAESDDGLNWNKCSNNPIISSASGPSIIKVGSKYTLFFHDSFATSIGYVETEDSLSCDSIWSNKTTLLIKDQLYDSKLITDPVLLFLGANKYLLYSGLSGSNVWSINLATKSVSPPVIQENKYVLIPGFMTTWNKNAVVYNDSSPVLEWKVFDFIKEYSGIISTFVNLGLIENNDFYVFPYDWRKPVKNLISDFESFLVEKELINPTINLNVIGHSFGGLIGRIYLQENPDHISKLITVGAPHQGTAKVYQPIQAGKIDLSTDFLSLAQNIVLNLNRSLNQSNKDIIKFLIPSLYDLYPNYDFLKNKDGESISKESLKIKNDLLPNYVDISEVSDKFFSIYSDYDQALLGFKVEAQSVIHKLFEHYEDGYPTESLFDSGDKNLPKISTSFGNNLIQITGDHEEIIYKKDSIKKIVDLLDITYIDDDIIEGAKTVINPSLIFIIKSPAVMEVSLADETFYEQDGLIFIPNASSGEYKLKVKGTGIGKYTVLVGQISQSNEIWEELNGEITNIIPTDQIYIYDIDYNNQTVMSILPETTETPTPTQPPTPTSIPTITPSPTPVITLTPSPTPTPTSTIVSNVSETLISYINTPIDEKSGLNTYSLPFKRLTDQSGEILGKADENKNKKQNSTIFNKQVKKTPTKTGFNYWSLSGLLPTFSTAFAGLFSFVFYTLKSILKKN